MSESAESDPLFTDDTLESRDSRYQFQLLHLLWVMTAIAFFCALAAPLIRAIEPGRHLVFLGMFVMQVAITGATIGYYSVRRVEIIKYLGKRIGIGYPGAIPGKHWPKIVSGTTLLAFALLQLTVAVLVTFSISGEAAPIAMAPFYGQLAFFSGSTVTQLFWGRSLGATEFFEKGIVRGAFQMIHWNDITIRKSQFSEDRIVMMIKPHTILSKGSPQIVGAWTTSLQVPHELREFLLGRFPEGPRPQLNQVSTAIGYSPGSERDGSQTNS